MTELNRQYAFEYAKSAWGWNNPSEQIIDRALLQLDVESKHLRTGQIIQKLELLTAERIEEILADNGSSVSKQKIMDKLIHGARDDERSLLGKNKNNILSLQRGVQYFESFEGDGVSIHPAMGEKDVLDNCRSLNAVLVLIELTNPVLVFSEIGESFNELNGIAEVDKAKYAIFKHLKLSDKDGETSVKAKRNIQLRLGVSANAEMIASAQNSVTRISENSESASSVLHHATLMAEEQRRSLALWHEVALKQGATDIHIVPDALRNSVNIELRVLGKMSARPDLRPMIPEYHIIKSFLQKESGATKDHAALREPADGEYHYIIDGKAIKVRASFIPLGTDNNYSENLVSIRLRLLDNEVGSINLDEIGIASDVQKYIRQAMIGDNGLVLMVGPTGSGKSTTQLGMVEAHRGIYDDTKSRMSVEDPVEREVDGISQVEFKLIDGLDKKQSLEKYLGALMRHDPDFMMIGEIRDGDTATFAANAGVTGHKTLATIHGSSTVEGMDRILNMINNQDQKQMVVNAITHLFGQRLIPILCDHCKRVEPITDTEIEYIEFINKVSGTEITLPDEVAHEGKGCDKCNHVGRVDRKPVSEVLELTPEIREMLLSDDPGKIDKLKKKRVLTLSESMMPFIESHTAPVSVLFEG